MSEQPEPPVRILFGRPGQPGAYLSRLRTGDGGWLVPVIEGEYGAQQAWAQGLTGEGLSMAVIDSGVELEHPVLHQAVAQALDVTGEGPEDLNGHGTVVSLLALATAPDATLISIKAVRADGFGTQDQLLAALELAGSCNVTSVNMSVGATIPSCRGDCRLCRAASALGERGIVVTAAAGNTPGSTDCPAKAGLHGGAVIAVGAWDIDLGAPAPYAGDAEFAGPVGRLRMVPVA